MSIINLRTKQFLAFAIGGYLFLALGSVASAEGEFTFPALSSQPVAIQRVVRSTEHYGLVILNRSSKRIHAIDLTFAGTACTRPYKPLWPGELRDRLDVSPGAYVTLNVSKSVLDGVAARSLASCGHAMVTEIAVTRVRFADGSSWDLGDRVRAGEPYESR